ncbi:MAG: hypothetical protein ACO3MW_07725 [Rhodospirillales bacterium]
MKTYLFTILASGIILVSGSALAQFGSTQVPAVTVPNTTQGMSDSASQAARDAMMKEQKEKAKKEAEMAKQKA